MFAVINGFGNIILFILNQIDTKTDSQVIMNSGISELYRLINSLTPHEFNRIKAHVKRVNGGKKQNWIVLFELIRKSDKVHLNDAVLKKFPQRNQRSQVIKNCFKRVGEIGCAIERMTSRSHLANFFLNRGIWIKANQLLEESVEEAIKTENYCQALDLMNLQIKTIKHLLNGSRLNEALDLVAQQKRKIADLNNELEIVEQKVIQYEKLANNQKNGIEISSNDLALLLDGLPNPQTELEGVKAKSIAFKILGFVSFVKEDNENYHFYLKRSYEQFENNPWLRSSFTEDYFRVAVITMNATIRSNDFGRVQTIWNQLDEIKIEEKAGQFYLIEFKLSALYIMAEGLPIGQRESSTAEFLSLFETQKSKIEEFCSESIYTYLAMLYVDVQFRNGDFKTGNRVAGYTISSYELVHPTQVILPLFHLIGLFQLEDIDGIDAVKRRYKNMIVKDAQYGVIGNHLFNFLARKPQKNSKYIAKLDEILENLTPHKDNHILSMAFSITEWLEKLKGLNNNEGRSSSHFDKKSIS